MKQGFSPVYDARTEILILGTAPSVKSLEKQQYYANPGNQFWNILFHSLAVEDPLEYSQRLELLKDHRIGLWDVYATFERKGSLDVNFSTIVPNDFTTLLTKARINEWCKQWPIKNTNGCLERGSHYKYQSKITSKEVHCLTHFLACCFLLKALTICPNDFFIPIE